MASEKMKYFKQWPELFDLERYRPALEADFNSIKNKAYVDFIMERIRVDRGLMYLMVATFLPLSEMEALELLKGVIADQKRNGDYVSEFGESEVADVADCLIKKRMAGVVITVLEPELEWVLEEGVYYQQALDRAREDVAMPGSQLQKK